MAIEIKRAVLLENGQLLVQLQLIWSVHNNTVLLIVVVMSQQLDREFPWIRNHLQGPLLCYSTSSINSIGSIYHNKK